MAGQRVPAYSNDQPIDPGTAARTTSPRPGPVGSDVSGMADLETALGLLKSEAINFGYRFIQDGAVRLDYIAKTQAISKTIRAEVAAGRLTFGEAAQEANKLRNAILDASRLKSSDLGRAIAEAAKGTGLTLPELEAYYAQKLLKKGFESLTQPEKNRVWLEIVEAAGRQRPSFNVKAVRLARVGRGFIVFSVAIAVYNVAAAEEKGRQASKEVTTAGAGVLGGVAGGALAGLACGPGAPVCVAIGIFAGGALAALGADSLFDWIW
jgi:hypothetical protein